LYRRHTLRMIRNQRHQLRMRSSAKKYEQRLRSVLQ
jgi:hypothetical protein